MEECLWFSSGYGRFVNGKYKEWSLEADGFPQVDPCNSRGEFVWLELSYLQLTGYYPSIPTEIDLLTSLSYIGLNGNDLRLPWASFSWFLFSERGGLTSLNSLSMANNSIYGPIPSELGILSKMQVLYLESNAFTGRICTELGNMTSLEEITLNDNLLSGSLPSELGQLTSLEWLQLRNLPLLTGSIPSELSLLTSLRFLDLRNSSGLSGTIPNELCYLQNASCTFLDWWGGKHNCTLKFNCTNSFCGCDCPCANSSLVVGT
jgi:hypothetical protein